MSRKPLLQFAALCVLICAISLYGTSLSLGKSDVIITSSPRIGAGSTPLSLNDGAEGTVSNGTATMVMVNSSGNLVSNLNEILFLVQYFSGDVNLKVTFSNDTFSAVKNTPQPIPEMNVFYLKVETNNSAAISGVMVTLKYNASEVLFTERALWMYSYNVSTQEWVRLDTIVDYDSHSVTFSMPSGNVIELCLTGQETRGMEFPIWAWILILLSFGIITFMAVGELVYQGYIPVAMKGTDGRVIVAFKRFFGAWGRKFTQLNDRVGNFIDYYENVARTVPPIPPEKRPMAISSLGHLNRLGMQGEEALREEDYSPLEILPKPVVMAKSEDKNPLEKAVFQESAPTPQEEPGEHTFTPYIPAAVRAKMGEKSQPKPVAPPRKEEKLSKSASISKQKPSPAVIPPTIETKSEEPAIPPDLLQEATAILNAKPAVEDTPKPAKKAAKKKAAKKGSKKAVK